MCFVFCFVFSQDFAVFKKEIDTWCSKAKFNSIGRFGGISQVFPASSLVLSLPQTLRLMVILLRTFDYDCLST